MARQLVVEIIGDSGKLTKSLDVATQSGGKFKNVLTGIGQGVGQAAFGLLQNAIGGTIGFLQDADAAFKADQASQALLAQALQNNIPNWNGSTAAMEAAATAALAKGFADDQARAALGQLVGTTHDQQAATELLTLAEDLARAKNIDLATATDAVQKASEGNGKALKAMGIDVANAKDATSLLDAVQKNVAGSAAAWAATSEGKVAISQQKTAEAMEKIGAAVNAVTSVALPLLADAFSTVIDIVTSLGTEIEKNKDILIPAFIAMGIAVATVLIPPFIAWAAAAVAAAAGTIVAMAPVLIPIAAIGAAVAGLAILWRDHSQEIMKIVGDVVKVFQNMGTVVGQIFDGIIGAIRSVINGVIGLINSAIDGINAIPDLDIGDVHIGIPHLDHIPTFHSGGIVPGAAGSEMLAILQAGERVIPANGAGGGNINLHVTVVSNDPDDTARKILLPLKRELARQGTTLW